MVESTAISIKKFDRTDYKSWVFDAELWAIGLALGETNKRRERLQKHGVKTVAVFSDSQASIQRMAHLEPGPGRRLARRINRRAQALLAHGIVTEIRWVPRHSSIRRNEEVDSQANLAEMEAEAQ
jgi:ribonuclease HI